VIRVEDGSLQELTHALADAIGKHKLVKNTVILMGSLSYLSNTGTEHYLTDLVRSRWWLRERFGEDIFVLPLAPVLVEGLAGHDRVRNTVETLSWFSLLNSTETVLMKGILTDYLGIHFTVSAGQGWTCDRQCFRLPAGLDSRATTAFVSDGWGS
jgi:hypothetical protein